MRQKMVDGKAWHKPNKKEITECETRMQEQLKPFLRAWQSIKNEKDIQASDANKTIYIFHSLKSILYSLVCTWDKLYQQTLKSQV